MQTPPTEPESSLDAGAQSKPDSGDAQAKLHCLGAPEDVEQEEASSSRATDTNTNPMAVVAGDRVAEAVAAGDGVVEAVAEVLRAEDGTAADARPTKVPTEVPTEATRDATTELRNGSDPMALMAALQAQLCDMWERVVRAESKADLAEGLARQASQVAIEATARAERAEAVALPTAEGRATPTVHLDHSYPASTPLQQQLRSQSPSSHPPKSSAESFPSNSGRSSHAAASLSLPANIDTLPIPLGPPPTQKPPPVPPAGSQPYKTVSDADDISLTMSDRGVQAEATEVAAAADAAAEAAEAVVVALRAAAAAVATAVTAAEAAEVADSGEAAEAGQAVEAAATVAVAMEVGVTKTANIKPSELKRRRVESPQKDAGTRMESMGEASAVGESPEMAIRMENLGEASAVGESPEMARALHGRVGTAGAAVTLSTATTPCSTMFESPPDGLPYLGDVALRPRSETWNFSSLGTSSRFRWSSRSHTDFQPRHSSHHRDSNRGACLANALSHVLLYLLSRELCSTPALKGRRVGKPRCPSGCAARPSFSLRDHHLQDHALRGCTR